MSATAGAAAGTQPQQQPQQPAQGAAQAPQQPANAAAQQPQAAAGAQWGQTQAQTSGSSSFVPAQASAGISPAAVTWTTMYSELPAAIQQELDKLEVKVRTHERHGEKLNAALDKADQVRDNSRIMEYTVLQVQAVLTDIGRIREDVQRFSASVGAESGFAERAEADVSRLKQRRHDKVMLQTAPSLPSDFFQHRLTRYREQMSELQRRIGELEAHVTSQSARLGGRARGGGHGHGSDAMDAKAAIATVLRAQNAAVLNLASRMNQLRKASNLLRNEYMLYKRQFHDQKQDEFQLRRKKEAEKRARMLRETSRGGGSKDDYRDARPVEDMQPQQQQQGAWGASTTTGGAAGGGWGSTSTGGAWGSTGGSGSGWGASTSGATGSSGAWGSTATTGAATSAWGAPAASSTTAGSAWGATTAPAATGGGWGATTTGAAAATPAWGSAATPGGTSAWGTTAAPSTPAAGSTGSAWGATGGGSAWGAAGGTTGGGAAASLW